MTYQLPEPTQLFCDAWFHSDEQIQTALHEAYAAGQRDMREAAAKKCDLVGQDWCDAGQAEKFYATNYLIDVINALPVGEMK